MRQCTHWGLFFFLFGCCIVTVTPFRHHHRNYVSLMPSSSFSLSLFCGMSISAHLGGGVIETDFAEIRGRLFENINQYISICQLKN